MKRFVERRIVLTGVVVTLISAGCGSGSGSTTPSTIPTSTTAASSTPSTAATTTEVTLPAETSTTSVATTTSSTRPAIFCDNIAAGYAAPAPYSEAALDEFGPPYVVNPPAALVGGNVGIDVIYSDYGTAVMAGIGRRMTGTRSILVAGVTRTWTAGAGTTNWNTANNWSPAAVPGTLDSVYVPVVAPLDPALVSSVSILGVTVEDVALISLGAFDLTAGGNVTTGLTGGITNTSGRLFLTGVAKTVQGKTAPLRVTGTYSLTGNVTSRASIQVDAGRLTVSGFRLQADSN